MEKRRRKYANNPAPYRERLRKLREEHPRKVREWKKRDYEKHREKYLRHKRQYYAENREKLKENVISSYRAWRKQRLDKLGRVCARCGYSEFECALDVHHVNGDLVVLCRNCHHSLHNGKWTLEELTCRVLA